MRILHLEDSGPDSELITALLVREWPACALNRVETREQFVAALEVGNFDLVLSDYTLGSFDGVTALELARVWCPEKPFIFLSGTIGEERAVEALKRGATDYVIKDRPARLVPSIRHAMARMEEAKQFRMTTEALRQNRERFREITENVADLIVLLDPEGRRIYHNPAYARALGDPNGLIGTDFFANVHPEDRLRIREGFLEIMRSGSAGQQSEYRIVRRDGAVRHIESHDSVIREIDGRVTHALLVARDVTDRRAAEHRIHEQAALLDKAQDAILVRNLTHRISYWNKGAEQLYGWTAAEVAGQDSTKLLMPDPVRLKIACDETLARGEWLGELRHRTKSGSEVIVQSRWTLMKNADGTAAGFLSINTDITEKIRLEAQFLRAQRMESMGMMVSGIAHDLNNVLAPILMSAGLLKLGAATDSTKKYITTIEEGAKHGAAMVRQLLSFARGTEGLYTDLSLPELLVDFEKFVQPTLPRNVFVQVKILAEPPQVRADVTQLKQVLMNLCVNARDAMPEGGRITLSLDYVHRNRLHELAQAEARGSYAVLSVADSGAGIPPEILDHIFDPFFTTKSEGKGTGLGLSNVRGIVKGHGGFITVDSKVGQGTVFRIHLPAAPEAPAKSVPSTSSLSDHDRPGILLVDDESVIRSVLEMILASSGYRVFSATTATEAIEIFEAHRSALNLIITDLKLDGMSGLELIHALHACDPHFPVIAISGQTKSSPLVKELQATGVPMLTKPIKSEELLPAVQSALKKQQPACDFQL